MLDYVGFIIAKAIAIIDQHKKKYVELPVHDISYYIIEYSYLYSLHILEPWTGIIYKEHKKPSARKLILN